MRRAISNGITINRITLVEIAHYFRRLHTPEFPRLMQRIQNLSSLTLVDLDDEVAGLALTMLPDYSRVGLGARDCVVIATMKLSGVTDLATHDVAFRNIQGIKVIDAIPLMT
jgi:predicted nucleic acid-binding protein